MKAAERFAVKHLPHGIDRIARRHKRFHLVFDRSEKFVAAAGTIGKDHRVSFHRHVDAPLAVNLSVFFRRIADADNDGRFKEDAAPSRWG